MLSVEIYVQLSKDKIICQIHENYLKNGWQ